MATYNVAVRKALSSTQQDLIDKDEHCSADPEKLATVGRAKGHQVRIRRSSTQYALYTVSQARQESPDNIVRMGAAGRERVGTSAEFSGTLDSQVSRSSLTDAQAEAESEFVERLTDNGTHRGLIVIAPHGGNIEQYTDRQAEHVASLLAVKGVSSWRCKGWKRGGGAHERWHITSTDIHQASFPLLNKVISRLFRYAVSFHGFSDPGVLIGGTASGTLKQQIKTAIEGAVAGSDITVRIARASDSYGGDSPRNVVNRITADGAGGLQIEQSFAARERHWQSIAEAVASVYRSRIT